MQLYRTDQSSPGLLLSGIMLVSIGLLRSATGSPTIINLKSYTSPLHTISKPHRRVVSGLEMARIWPPTSCSHASSAGNGTGLRRHRLRVNPWMDSAHKAIFSPMLSGRKYCLWCWWDPMARPQQTAGSISPPMHNCHVFLCSQYSRVYLFIFAQTVFTAL